MHDIHSHVLFDIDDGAKQLDMSIELLRSAAEDGTRRIVATPHIRDELWPNRRPGIVARLEEVRAEVRRQRLDIEVVLGAELYFSSELFAGVRSGEFPTYADRRRYVLFELSRNFVARQVQDTVFRLQGAGIVPVLAHPERNQRLMAQPELVAELVGQGTVMQLTAMSITGRFGRSAKKAADELLRRGLAHVVASDAHRPDKRPALLGEARASIARDYGEARAQTLFVDNPRRIIDGEEVDVAAPAPPRRRGLAGWLARLRR